MATPSPADSQQALALSIARAVQLGLPAADSEEAIRESVEKALFDEASRNEEALARLRVGTIGVVVLLNFAAYRSPGWLDLDLFPSWPFIVALIWLAAAVALLLVLRTGGYRRWLRRAIPVMDAAGIVATGLVLEASLAPSGVPLPAGTMAAVAVACSFLAFSGALRLSRSAAQLATGLGVAAWFVIGLGGGVTWLATFFIAAAILATGVLASRVGRMVRRVIIDEVTRVRLVRMYQDAQAAIDAREEVLKIVSHDLRNPLGTIAMATDMLLDMPTAEDARNRYLGMIKRQGERMRRLINDLLDAARVESGRLPIAPQPTDLAELLEAALEMMRPLATDRKLELHAPDLEQEWPRVHVDPERILQVFSNLIGNAIKFTQEGGSITLKLERDGDKVRIGVADTGPGIAPEQLSEIFGRMWQAQKDDARGIGLGLTIAKAIVEAHGERIGVESEVGVGTEFWFTVPVAAGTGRGGAASG